MGHKAMVVLDLFSFGPNQANNTPDPAMGLQLCGETEPADSSLGKPCSSSSSNRMVVAGVVIYFFSLFIF